MKLTFEKLPGIRTDLVRMDDAQQEWGFSKLAESLQMSTDRNPNAVNISEEHEKYKHENVHQIKEKGSKNRESNPKPHAGIHIL